jgi:hypothetical protein
VLFESFHATLKRLSMRIVLPLFVHVGSLNWCAEEGRTVHILFRKQSGGWVGEVPGPTYGYGAYQDLTESAVSRRLAMS